jgi:hypothetical protein
VSTFDPNLSMLPPHRRALWPELSVVPPHFVLYGDTAIALRLGHRQSADFDFMSPRSFTPETIVKEAPFLGDAVRLQSQEDTLTVSVTRGAPVKLSFFGGISFGRVGSPHRVRENGLWIASLLDLAALKLAVVQQRAEAKDYLDLYALLRAGISLEEGLGAARALYGAQFNPAITLKALAYFGDGDLSTLPREATTYLAGVAARVGAIPDLVRASRSLAPEESVSS